MVKEKRKRVEWVDTARGLGILMVMYGHTYLDWKYVFWCYAFHMALFFSLSGYVFHPIDFSSFLKKRVKGLIVPYIFFAVVITVYNWVGAVSHSNMFSMQDAALPYLIQIRYTHLWFLPCLFLAELGTWFIFRFYSKEDRKKNNYLFIAFALIVLFFVYRNCIGVDLPWNADLSVLAMGFMLLGIWYHLCVDDYVSVKCRSFLLVFIVITTHFIITWVAFITTESVDWYSNRFGNPLFFILGSCTGIFATILISKRLHLRQLASIGANGIVWYGLHRIVIDMTFIIYNKMQVHIIKGSLLSVVLAVVSVGIAVIVLVPVNIVITKYFPFLIGRKKRRLRND